VLSEEKSKGRFHSSSSKKEGAHSPSALLGPHRKSDNTIEVTIGQVGGKRFSGLREDFSDCHSGGKKQTESFQGGWGEEEFQF